MERLCEETIIKTNMGLPIKIIKELGEGGQAVVYLVEYQGDYKALKWFEADKIPDKEAFYENLQEIINHGSPDSVFIWPEELTEKKYGSFGYLMKLIPKEYHKLSEIMNVEGLDFKSFKEVTETAIRITFAYRKLHKRGYSYQDINYNNLYINVDTGDVLIGDNDNITPDGVNLGIIGTPRYMAPEVGSGERRPNTQSDRYSLAVILFCLFFWSHPLEGEQWLGCLTDKKSMKLYVTNPVFILDPGDASNRPVKNIHKHVLERWPFMPDYFKAVFVRAFSKEAIHNPQSRVTEHEWLKVLTRFRSDIIICSCGNNLVIKEDSQLICDNCGKGFAVEHTLQLPDYKVCAVKGTRIYRCQLGFCNGDRALDRVGLVTDKGENNLGLRNLSDITWSATTPSGKSKTVAPGETVPLKAGIELRIFDSKIKILK